MAQRRTDHVFLRQTGWPIGKEIWAIVSTGLSVVAIVETIRTHGHADQWLVGAVIFLAITAVVEARELHQRQKRINQLEARRFDPVTVKPEHATALKAILTRGRPPGPMGMRMGVLSDHDREIFESHFPETYGLLMTWEAAEAEWISDRTALMAQVATTAPSGEGWINTEDFCNAMDAYLTAGEQTEEGVGPGRPKAWIEQGSGLGTFVIEHYEDRKRQMFQVTEEDRVGGMCETFDRWMDTFLSSAAFDKLRQSRQRNFNYSKALNIALTTIQDQPTIQIQQTGCSHCP